MAEQLHLIDDGKASPQGICDIKFSMFDMGLQDETDMCSADAFYKEWIGFWVVAIRLGSKTRDDFYKEYRDCREHAEIQCGQLFSDADWQGMLDEAYARLEALAMEQE